MSEIFRDLLKPENRVVLYVLLTVFILFDVYVLYLIKGGWLRLKFPGFAMEPAKGKHGHKEDKPEKAEAVLPPRGYRKILFVKVTCLTDRTRVTKPVYIREVPRLKPSERAVAVFDEAVYYTLELLPKKTLTEPRKERTSGVVDPRLVLPWQDEVQFRDAAAKQIKEWVQLESNQETDTFFSVSHFENGLQGEEQDIGTDVREDAEWVRVVADFSTVPNATKFITATRACIRLNGQEELAPISQPGPGVFTVMCKEVKKDAMIVIYFKFDWDRAT